MPPEMLNQGRNNVIEIHPDAVLGDKVKVHVLGNNNVLRIGANTRMVAGILELRNHDSVIEIGSNCIFAGSYRCRAGNTAIRIGHKTTINSAMITLHEAGAITLGRDCMLSGDIQMDVSDMHSILDAATGTRINPPGDITLGDHVWIGNGVRVLKGVTIGDNCVIGMRAMVTKDIPAGSLAVGTPARVLREGVTWDRRRLPFS